MGIRSFWLLGLIISTPLLAEKGEKASGELHLLIRGKNIPPPSSLLVNIDVKTCGERRKTEAAIQDERGGLENVVVWLEPLSIKAPPPPWPLLSTTPSIQIKNCDFEPHILIAAPEETISIDTSDPVLFQIRARGQKNPKFSRTLPPNLEGLAIQFQKPEIIPLSCDLHPWMHAFVVIASNRWYRISSKGGVVKFGGLPPGTYAVELWHEILGRKRLANPVVISTTTISQEVEWDYKD